MSEYKRKSNNRGLWTNEGLLDAVDTVQNKKMDMNAASRVSGISVKETNEK